jgi:hypothetical protein
MKTVLVKRRLVRLETKVLHTSGYADDAIVRCECEDRSTRFLRSLSRENQCLRLCAAEWSVHLGQF